ncbi:unnamed protein product [Allacma fusca]|uniref:Integrase zinc-binding domain-containing protein n=1 Tax=Allacma fusca TaxID=39272 RepID=A0A8J2LIW6_9HEXA|nr:unnamed protein product [Allacma fusca]
MLMQKLWSCNIGWDCTPTEERLAEWKSYQQDLLAIKSLRIPRWIIQDNCKSVQLHGFSDASTKAYAAAVYIRTVSRHDRVMRVESLNDDPQGEAYSPSTRTIPSPISLNVTVTKDNISCNSNAIPVDLSFMERYSTWSKLQRHTAWWIRFWKYARGNGVYSQKQLSAAELLHVRNRLLFAVQRKFCQKELSHLNQHGNLPSKSPYFQLSVFLDPKDGLLKAGGRLENAQIRAEYKHPIILPRTRLAQLLVNHYHLAYLHAGPQLLWYLFRQQYWMLQQYSCGKEEAVVVKIGARVIKYLQIFG